MQVDYLLNAIKACKAGANRVHLISGETQAEEVFSSPAASMVYANQYSSIRPAAIDDPGYSADHAGLHREGYPIPRTQESISESSGTMWCTRSIMRFTAAAPPCVRKQYGGSRRHRRRGELPQIRRGRGDRASPISTARMRGCYKSVFLLTTQATLIPSVPGSRRNARRSAAIKARKVQHKTQFEGDFDLADAKNEK